MTCTGVCVFDLGTQQPVFIGSIKTKPKETHGERLNAIRNYMRDIINTYKPYEVAIEKGFTMHNTSTQVIYRVHGITNELFYEYPQFYYAPTTVKKLVGHHGKAKKDVVQQFVLKAYPNINFKNEDESDAVGVAISHLIKKYKMKW